MPGILYLQAGPEFARRVFQEEGRGYWAAAFHAVLEKHGVAGVEVAELPPRDLEGYDAILVGRLPEAAWSDGLADALVACRRPVLVEAPLPRALWSHFGVTAVEPEEPEVVLRLLDEALRRAPHRYGALPAARLAPPRTREVPRAPEMDWRALGVPLEDAQAAAWRRRGWELERWSTDGSAEALAEWVPAHGAPYPALLRRGELVASSAGLFGLMAQAHTSEPWDSGEHRSSGRSFRLEVLLLTLIDEMHRRAGAVRARILPWPRGASWALNVRHDFDRPLTAAQVEAVLVAHARAGTAATWYWRARHLRSGRRRRRTAGNLALAAVVAAPGHEVALHTEALWAGGERELEDVAAVAGSRPLGSSSHGDPSCFRFQGAPNPLWAHRHGLRYTELIQHAHYHPHRFPALAADGAVEVLDLVCLPHHESFDRGTGPDEFAADRVLGAPGTFAPVGGLLQVMNHPDIHVEALFETLEQIPRGGRLDWTAAQVADWWSRTHVGEALRVRALGDGRFRASSTAGVTGVAVELVAPDGERRVRVLDLDPGASAEVSLRLAAAAG